MVLGVNRGSMLRNHFSQAGGDIWDTGGGGGEGGVEFGSILLLYYLFGSFSLLLRKKFDGVGAGAEWCMVQMTECLL